ncbi:hypothetical protein [Streptomyces sp. NPDC001678]|uniref:hypothetical protein n=1 Tax=Streptomyces sp. NPDC001678 TaxID=3364599 RepID=UPI0036751DEB
MTDGDGDGGRPVGRRAVCGLGLGLAAAALTGCGPGAPAAPPEPDAASVRRLLDHWAAAVRRRDENAYLAVVDPAADGYRAERRLVFANLAAVPLASWEYRLVRLAGTVAEAELRYRLAGYDTAPVTAPLRLTLTRRDGRWYVAGQETGHPAGQLWEQGRVAAVRGGRSLVLGVGQDERLLSAVAGLADAAVPAVDAAWGGRWAKRVVVEVPASLERMGALLQTPAANYRGIAAVATGDRIVVNPEAYGELGDFGRRIVLTHETTHVATRAVTTAATPKWLSEGFADWAAYRGTDRTARQAAPELAASVDAGDLPSGLPANGDFAFTGEAGRLARAYEGGWLACRMIAEGWGEGALVAFYRAGKDGFREVLGMSEGDFTAKWRSYVAGAF